MQPHINPGNICEFEQPGRVTSHTMMSDASFHWMVLPRCGKRPLAVVGRSLLLAHNRCAGLPYWSEISIHETASGRFAASLRHMPSCESTPDDDSAVAMRQSWCDAWLCDTPDAVRAAFHDHDPLWALPPLAPASRQTLPDAPGIITELPVFGDNATAQRFQAAWAGLLAAVFGLFPPCPGRSARPAA
jgi:hypothetical protein